jgi:hypothetical protein
MVFPEPDADLDFDADLVYRWRGELFTGVGYEERPVRSEITYLDGQQTGPARDFYASGQQSAESLYFHGVLHGWSRNFAEDGTCLAEVLYEFGMAISPQTGEALDASHQPLLDLYRRQRRDWSPVRK